MTALLSLLVTLMWQTSDVNLLIAYTDRGDTCQLIEYADLGDTYQFSDDYDGDGLE
jgi:hypothetical protein